MRLALLALPLLVAPAMTVALAAPAVAAPPSCANVAAHRGSHDATHTENTLGSARLALDQGANAIEGDLQLTRDGIWVLMHDSSVDRTTTGSGAVSALTYAQVRALTTKDGVVRGVPSANALLTLLDAHPDTRMELEIKPGNPSADRIRSLLATFDAHRVKSRLTITSFNKTPLRAIRTLYAGWRTALISTTRVSVAGASPYGGGVVIEQHALTASYVATMHHRGFTVEGWTIDDQGAWQNVVSAGVDRVVTNTVPGVRAWCAGEV